MRNHWFRKPQALLAMSLALILLLALACGTAAPPEAEEAAPPAAVMEDPTPVSEPQEAPEAQDWVSIGANHHYNGTIRFVHRANPGFLDVHYGASSTTTLLPSGPRFNQLLQYDPTNPQEIVGDLAKSWEVSDDGMTLTFDLNEANWHDGEPFTADDVVFSLDRMAQEGVTRGRVTAIRDFYQAGTAQAPDDRTVVMPLTNPSPTALGWLAVDYYKIYARHVVEGASQDDLNCCFENNLGTGPWRFKEWRKGDSWEFERNEDYFKNPVPFYDNHKVFVIEDAARRLASMKTGQVEAWLVMGGTTLADMVQVQRETNGRMRAASSGAGTIRGFWLNVAKPPLDDPRVRRAIYLALDREEIGEVAVGDEAIMGNFFPPGYAQSEADLRQLPGFRAQNGGKHPDDLAEATSLMSEAGFPDGFQLTFNVDQARQSRTEAEMVAAQLRDKLNIDLDLQVQDRASFYANLRDGTHDLSIIGTALFFLEPQAVLAQWFVKDSLRNPHNWEHPRLNELVEMESRELNQEVRRGYYREMAEILNQGESHYIVLYWQGRAGAVDYRIQNFRAPYHPHTIWRWDQIWWDPNAELPGPDAPPLQ